MRDRPLSPRLRAVRHAGRLGLILLAATLAGIGACTTSQADDPPTGVAAPPSYRSEFQAIADRLYGGTNRYLGRAKIARLRRALNAPNLPSNQRLEGQVQLVLRYLEAGDVDQAVAAVDKAISMAQRGGRIPANLHRLRGITYLRQAELQNCVARHNGDCCIFPLEGGAVHTEQGPARQAHASFSAFLTQQPHDLKGRWLLNICAMAIGEYPASVPERFLIPPESFTSDAIIPRFRDVAPDLGVDAFNLCGGTIADDLDGDGLIDIVTSTYDPAGPLTVYRNLGPDGFENRSTPSRADDQMGGLNCIGADYDNDGDVDVLVLRGAWLYEDGRIRNSLLRNDGNGVFTDVTFEAGLSHPARPTQAAAFADFDNDGHLDLYIGNESRVRTVPEADYPGQLYRNNGDGTFTDIASAAGVTNDRYCKGVATGDFDDDGDIDLYLSNVGPNRLYRNNGDGTFTDVAPEAGVVEPSDRSFATWFFDVDGDGDLDLFCAAYAASVADLAAEALGQPHTGALPKMYINQGDGTFIDEASRMNLDHVYLPMGANFGDIDNDGWLDIYLTTGDPDFQSLMPNVMLRNNRGQGFQNVTSAGGFGHLQKGHGVAFADFDNDGDQDIYHQLGGFFPGDRFHNALFVNPGTADDQASPGWLTIKLVGTETNTHAYGAKIRVVLDTPTGERTIHRWVGSVSSFGGSPSRQEIGLGDATGIIRVEIDWPRSDRQILTDVTMNTIIRVTEGSPLPEAIDVPTWSLDD